MRTARLLIKCPARSYRAIVLKAFNTAAAIGKCTPEGLTALFVELRVISPALREEFEPLESSYQMGLWQGFFNRAVREVIDAHPGLRETLCVVLRQDQEATDPELSEECGRFVRKDHGRDLLKHFLGEKPDPAWLDQPPPETAQQEEG